jgi:SNF2 family DNA or RNA helicase
LDSIIEKLKLLREKEGIELPDSPLFRKTFQHRSGEERPLLLRDYQKQMVVHLMAMTRFVVGDDTGLGKTIETISACCQIWRREPDTKVLVITKKSSMTPGWDVEGFHAFTEGVQVFLANGGPEQRAQMQKAWIKAKGPCVLIQSYGSTCRDFSKMQGWANHTIVYDEATVFKNPKTRVHKVCHALAAKAKRVWGLTATLIKNNLVEGYGIFRIVAPEVFPYNQGTFIDTFAIVRLQRVAQGRQVPVIVGYSDASIARFRDRIDAFYLGRPKHAVAKELPVLTTRDIFVGLSTWQEEKYAEAESGCLVHGSGEVRNFEETAQLTALIYCQEICDHPGLIEYPDYESEKLDALEDLLTESDLAGEKVIIFTRFSKMVAIAKKHLEKKGLKCVQVTGDESSTKRKEAMLSFQDPKSDVTVIFITMAGGDAINLQAAKALIFYDTPWSAGDYIQILGRMIRIGSEHDRVLAIHLICKGTIDEYVQAVVKKKMTLITKTLGERIKGEAGDKIVYNSSSDVSMIWDAIQHGARARKGLPPLVKAKSKFDHPVPAARPAKMPPSVPPPDFDEDDNVPSRKKKLSDDDLGL